MLPRARRVSGPAVLEAFGWSRVPPASLPLASDPEPLESLSPSSSSDLAMRVAELERDGFATGFAQGERAGLEAGSKRAEAILRRLGQTIDELEAMRGVILQQTERQVLQLALAIARRIVQREVTRDPEHIALLTQVALDRLSTEGVITVRLNPDDYTKVVERRGSVWDGRHVTLVADPSIARGGCSVESDFGYIDASLDAQFDELTRALLEDPSQGPFVSLPDAE